MPVRKALVTAAYMRLRAVLLTSLTTIAGLLPLTLEKSLQAQFLIPMATSISFGPRVFHPSGPHRDSGHPVLHRNIGKLD